MQRRVRDGSAFSWWRQDFVEKLWICKIMLRMMRAVREGMKLILQRELCLTLPHPPPPPHPPWALTTTSEKLAINYHLIVSGISGQEQDGYSVEAVIVLVACRCYFSLTRWKCSPHKLWAQQPHRCLQAIHLTEGRSLCSQQAALDWRQVGLPVLDEP